MAIIRRQKDQPSIKGCYSKIVNRKIVTGEVGAESCTIWKQTIPSGDYIEPHYHEFEEILIFLSGHVQVTIEGKNYQIEANTTVFIPPRLTHIEPKL